MHRTCDVLDAISVCEETVRMMIVRWTDCVHLEMVRLRVVSLMSEVGTAAS